MISVKIFLGCPLPFEIEKKTEWKKSQIMRHAGQGELDTALLEGKKYVGCSLDKATTPQELRSKQKLIIEKLEAYGADTAISPEAFSYFIQVYVS